MSQARRLACVGLVLLGAACATAPERPVDGVARMAPESYYRVAPWTRTRPKDFVAAHAALEGGLEGAYQAQAAYVASLESQAVAQRRHWASQDAYVKRQQQINRCLHVGGGRAAGRQCFDMGYDAYQARQRELAQAPRFAIPENPTIPKPRPPGFDRGWYDAWQLGEATYWNFRSYEEWMRSEIRWNFERSGN
jgi:hypothetical protein